MRLQVSLVCAAQGCVLLQPGVLLELLAGAVADHGALLVAQRADMQERVGGMNEGENKNRADMLGKIKIGLTCKGKNKI